MSCWCNRTTHGPAKATIQVRVLGGTLNMKDNEFKDALCQRRADLRMTYKELQRRTELGYNTVRRVFSDPMNCRIGSVVRVARAMGCFLDFTIEQHIGDEIEPDIPIEPLTQKEVNEQLDLAGREWKPGDPERPDE